MSLTTLEVHELQEPDFNHLYSHRAASTVPATQYMLSKCEMNAVLLER